MLPDRKWVLETGREYEVLIEVYDKNSHRLHPSDVSYSWENGNSNCFAPFQKGIDVPEMKLEVTNVVFLVKNVPKTTKCID